MVYIYPTSQGNRRGMCPCLAAFLGGRSREDAVEIRQWREASAEAVTCDWGCSTPNCPYIVSYPPKKNTWSEGCVLIPMAVTLYRTLPTPRERPEVLRTSLPVTLLSMKKCPPNTYTNPTMFPVTHGEAWLTHTEYLKPRSDVFSKDTFPASWQNQLKSK